jgi:hypothetical protein
VGHSGIQSIEHTRTYSLHSSVPAIISTAISTLVLLAYVCLCQKRKSNNASLLHRCATRCSRPCFYGEFVASNNKTYLYVRRYFCPTLSKFGFPPATFIKVSDIKIHEKPSSGGRTDISGQTDSQTDMTKLTVAFSEHANAPQDTIRVPTEHTPV